jgi:DNA invertase Pin-like site-specific DNA recombinase
MREPEALPTSVKRKAYSYVRFSTPEQSAGDSNRRQIDMARRYADEHGLELDTELTFRDEGKSAYLGANARTGRLGDFLECVSTGLVPKGSVLLVEQLDRLSRMVPRKALDVLADICDQGVSVVTLNDGREYTADSLDNDPTDLLISILVFMRANEESLSKSKRGKATWEHKRATIGSRILTRKAPAWLEVNEAGDGFEVIPDRGVLIKRIFDLTLNGWGQHRIADSFNREGLKPWGRGAFWQRSYIAKILRNDATIGTLTPHTLEVTDKGKQRRSEAAVENYYPAVIERETFDTVQSMYQSKAGLPRGKAGALPVRSILAGLAVCPLCESTMTRIDKGKKSRPSLVCTKAKIGAGCTYKSVPYQSIEIRLVQYLPVALLDHVGMEVPADLERQHHNAQVLVDVLQDRIEDILDLLSDEPSSVIANRVRAMEKELDAAKLELKALSDRIAEVSGPVMNMRIQKAVKLLKEPDESLDRAAVNAALRALFSKAIINWPEVEVDLYWKNGGALKVQYGWKDTVLGN